MQTWWGKSEAGQGARRGWWLVALPAGLWLALHAAATWDPARLWGVALLSYYPAAVAAGFYLVPVVAAVLPARAVAPTLRRLTGAAAASRAFAPVLVTLCTALFIVGRVRAHTLGDSVKWFSVLRNALFHYRPFEQVAWHNAALHVKGLEFVNVQQAGDILLHYGVFAAGHALLGWSAPTAYAVVSIAAGAAYVPVLWHLARRLAGDTGGPPDPVEAVVALAFFLTLGTVQLFCGYGESYTLLTLLSALYLVTAVDVLRGRASVWRAAAILALATFTHSLAVTLAPSWLLLVWHDERLGPYLRRPVIAWPLGLAGGAAVVAFYLAFYRDLHLPLWTPDAPGRYAILSREHAWTWLNEILLLSPFGLVWGLAGLARRGRPADPVRTLLGAATLGPALLLGVHDITMGGRDWDLMSFPALPAAAWGLVALRGRLGAGTAGAVARWVLPVAALHTALWVGVNASPARAEARLEHLLVHTNQETHYRAWTRGYYYMERGPEFMPMAEAAFSLAVSTAPADHLDTPGTRPFSYRKFQAVAAARLDHFVEALRAIRRIHELEPEPSGGVNDVALYWEWVRSAHSLALEAYRNHNREGARQLWLEARFALGRLLKWRHEPADRESLQVIEAWLKRTEPGAERQGKPEPEAGAD